MLLKSVLPSFGIATLQAVLMCNPGFAATRTASISVSATVVAGCQVSPVQSAAKSTALEAKHWETSVSMSCSLPVPYQVSITNSVRTDLVPRGPINSDPAGPFPYARTIGLSLLQPRDLPDDSINESDHGSTSVQADSIKGPRTTEDTHSETITVTVIY